MVNENNSSNIDFFDSMRKIFDSVDLNRSGFAPYERLCAKCEDRHFSPQFPPSFFTFVRRFCLPNGCITFESFITAAYQSFTEQNSHNHDVEKRKFGPKMGLIGLDWKTVHNNQSAVTSKNALEN
ncbi:unnamed protein product [Dracunculus medinensis]|uniref:EF-hand domain-containing protein n=1 Tax=Dracunculus medinensis TaxID=318479 RepID=A0A158Q4X6_DRAME|nr:unnamed protein product [Dracunculus medinensis]